MHVYKADPEAGKVMPFDENQYLFTFQNACLRQLGEQGQDLMPVGEVTAREFAYYERMTRDLSIGKQPLQPGIALF
jgi:hypothetical protein